MHAKGRVEIYPGAVIHGDITYSQINVHPDAKVNGNLKCLLPDTLHTLVTSTDSDDVANNVLRITKVNGL